MQVGCPNSLFDSVELPVPQKKFPVLPIREFRPPIRPDMIFGKDSGERSPMMSQPVSQLGCSCEKCQSVEVKVAGSGP